jgi:2OG-Fe(II) oxygenase superfamily
MLTAQRFVPQLHLYQFRMYSPLSKFLDLKLHRLGCAAIFLIGGNSRDTVPTPILLRSGDVVIMSGPACRRAYHGMSFMIHVPNVTMFHRCSKNT